MTSVAAAGQTISSGNAVILKSSIQNYILTPSAATAVTLEDNSLRGVDEATPVSSAVTSGTCYVLSGDQTHGVGFFQYASDKTLKAHKAYVVIGSGSAGAPKRLRFVFNTPTGIEEANGQELKANSLKVIRDGHLIIIRNGVRYNAQGQIVK